MRGILALVLMFASLQVSAMTQKEIADLQIERSPYIAGDTLYIWGPITSNIYDYLAYGAKDVAKVKYVDLNSFGGDLEWAMASAEKLQALGLTTRVGPDHYCASACVPLFASGKQRLINSEGGLGIHAARLSVGMATTFDGVCMMTLDDGSQVFNGHLKGCKDFMTQQTARIQMATDGVFAFLESQGVSPELRKYYFGLPLDPEWYKEYNLLQTPDMHVDAPMALKYGLATGETGN